MIKDVINKLIKDGNLQIQEKGENEFTLFSNDQAMATIKGIEDVISPEMNEGRIFMLKYFQQKNVGRFLILCNNDSCLLIDWNFIFPYDEYFNNIDKLLTRIQQNKPSPTKYTQVVTFTDSFCRPVSYQKIPLNPTNSFVNMSVQTCTMNTWGNFSNAPSYLA
jgi:hypothetical protein